MKSSETPQGSVFRWCTYHIYSNFIRVSSQNKTQENKKAMSLAGVYICEFWMNRGNLEMCGPQLAPVNE